MNLEQCPLCGSELSQTKFREIRAKLRSQDEKRATEIAEAKATITRKLEEELKARFDQQKLALEKKIRDEAEQRFKKADSERQQLAERLKGAEVRGAEIQKQAQMEIQRQKLASEKKAKADAEQQIQKISAERDKAAAKAKAAEAREAESRKQMQEEAERQRQKELSEQRQALEKATKLALLKQQSEFNRERESLQKKLERKTANELGDGGEVDVFEAVRDAFDGTGGKTTQVPKGVAGADILHEVFHKGEPCGRIIIDAKNRQSWQNVFVTKLRQDQVQAGAEHAILATTVFPTGKKGMCVESGVIVISPDHVVHIVQLLRQALITMHIKGLSLKERTTKMSQLYSLITSESYSAKFAEANRLTQDILELDVQEKTAHDNVWKKRGALAKRMHNVLREVETDVAAVIEGNDEAVQGSPFVETKRAAAASAG
jgi:hypothetical protein